MVLSFLAREYILKPPNGQKWAVGGASSVRVVFFQAFFAESKGLGLSPDVDVGNDNIIIFKAK